MDYEQRQSQLAQIRQLEQQDTDNRPKMGPKLIKFLDRASAFEYLHNLDSRTVSFNQFESYLLRINGILRGIAPNQRQFDGKEVKLRGQIIGSVLFPRYEDKEKLLEVAFETAKKLSQEDRAYLLPAVINSLHLFNDGNGRTSRVLFLILTATDKSRLYLDLEKTLGSEGRYETLDISPSQIDFEIERYILQTFHGWSVAPGGKLSRHVSLKGGIAMTEYSQIDKSNQLYADNVRRFAEIASIDFYYLLTAVVETLTPEQYENILLRGKWISPIKMALLPEQEWSNIFEAYYKLKRDHVTTLIDVFANPNKYKNPEKTNETFREMFKRRINEESERNK